MSLERETLRPNSYGPRAISFTAAAAATAVAAAAAAITAVLFQRGGGHDYAFVHVDRVGIP